MKSILLLATLLFAAQASALGQGKLEGVTITEIFVDGRAGIYGGCLIALDVNPNTIDASCQYGKVSLSCDGLVGVTKGNAAINLSMVQLAFVTGSTVDLWVDANKNAGGACVATSVWLASTPG